MYEIAFSAQAAGVLRTRISATAFTPALCGSCDMPATSDDSENARVGEHTVGHARSVAGGSAGSLRWCSGQRMRTSSPVVA